MVAEKPRQSFSPEETKKLQAVLDQDPFSTAFTSQSVPSAIEKFVNRGDNVEDLLLRAHFRDVNHKNACVRLLRKAKHFEDKELEEAILNSIAGDPSIGGMRIDILLQAVTGYMKQKMGHDFGKSFRNFMGMGDDNKPG